MLATPRVGLLVRGYEAGNIWLGTLFFFFAYTLLLSEWTGVEVKFAVRLLVHSRTNGIYGVAPRGEKQQLPLLYPRTGYCVISVFETVSAA